jgi:hypothetical protein
MTAAALAARPSMASASQSSTVKNADQTPDATGFK